VFHFHNLSSRKYFTLTSISNIIANIRLLDDYLNYSIKHLKRFI